MFYYIRSKVKFVIVVKPELKTLIIESILEFSDLIFSINTDLEISRAKINPSFLLFYIEFSNFNEEIFTFYDRSILIREFILEFKMLT